jgi:hypothetical protein
LLKTQIWSPSGLGNELSPNMRKHKVTVCRTMTIRKRCLFSLLVQSMGEPKFREGSERKPFPPPRNSNVAPKDDRLRLGF